MLLEYDPEFFKNLDHNLLLFAREIRRELREEGHVAIGVTGYPGKGKSNTVALLGALIDKNYTFDKNICFIPTSREIEDKYMSFPKYSFFHIDEASRGLHKHKWHDKVQQKINELYDTEREGHFLCTTLIMPRFQNFTENFRNFMITYWIDIPQKGIAVFYKKDEDKDVRDPWHMDENYKAKMKKWRGKRIFERSVGEKIRVEQITDCYWFYCQIPPIPKEIWGQYQLLKKESRIAPEEQVASMDPAERRQRESLEKENKIIELYNKGLKYTQISVVMGIGHSTVSRYVRQGLARKAMEDAKSFDKRPESLSYLYKPIDSKEKKETKEGFNNTLEK